MSPFGRVMSPFCRLKLPLQKMTYFYGIYFFGIYTPRFLQLSTPTTQWGDMAEILEEFSTCHILAGTANNRSNWLQEAPTTQVSRTTLGGAS